MTLTDVQKKEIYKECANKTLYQVGVQFGFNQLYQKKGTIEQKVYQIKREVEANPQKFGITKDVMDMVQAGAKERVAVKREDPIAITSADVLMKDLSQNVAKKALMHIDKKLNSKNLKDVSIMQLAQVFGITLDKFLLLSGRATENVAFKAKIDVNMSSADLMAQLLKVREIQNEENTKK